MSIRDFVRPAGKRFIMITAGLLAAPAVAAQQQPKPATDKIPEAVMKTLKGKFPKADIHKWTKEHEDGAVVYDMEFTQDGRKFEADVTENGSIVNWEQEVTAKDLPDA